LNSFSRLPVTFGLIGACVAVYVAVAVAGQGYGWPLNVGLVTQPPDVLGKGALVPALVAQGRAWLLFTSMFLHAGFVHLALNMLSLYFLGSFVEVAFGRGRFLALYLTSGLAGGLAYLYFGDFDGTVVGASGAIFGILGALFVLERKGSIMTGGQVAGLIVLNLIFTFAVSNISVGGHVGGLIGGVVLMWLLVHTRRSAAQSIAATVAVVVASVIVAYAKVRGYS
jgi:rhomboid protease GluP